MASSIAEKLRENYIAANPKSRQASERARKSLPGGSTRSTIAYAPFPLVMKSGKGCHVTSLDGVEYVDFVCEFSAGIFGHSHPRIHEAVQQALSSGINLGSQGVKEVELAERLLARFKSMDMIRFCNSGTEANMYALALATHHTKRSKILVFRRAYHGGTLYFENIQNPINLPHDFVFGEFNDIEKTTQVLTPDVGTILVEPMQHVGDLTPASKEFLQFLREAADRIGAVLIFDEVVTSRLHFHGLQEHYGVYPDMTTLGKYVGGGFSFGAFGGKRAIMCALDPANPHANGLLSQGGTWNNNVFSMAAGVAACDVLTEIEITRVNALGDKLRAGIRQILDSNGLTAARMTGMGSLIGLVFAGPDRETLTQMLFLHMLEHRIYMGWRAFWYLNIIHDESHIERVLEVFKTFAELLVKNQGMGQREVAVNGHGAKSNGVH